MTPSYLEIIKDHGFASTTSGVWLSVGEPQKKRGWKIHLSIVPLDACQLLANILPLLKGAGVSFKLIKDFHNLELLNSGESGSSQRGKFMTIYTASDSQAVDLAERLMLLTIEFSGPAIPADLHIGGIVYARYGAFTPVIKKPLWNTRTFALWSRWKFTTQQQTGTILSHH